MIDQSLWRTLEVPRFGAEGLPDRVDVVVVGAGITGLTAAYLLKRAGKRVAVFDRERVGAGESGNTSAHLTYVTDLRLKEIVSRFGREAGRLVWDGGAAAIDLIETNAEALAIDCGFQRVPGFLCSAFLGERATKDESGDLLEEATVAADLGFAAQYRNRGPITGRPAITYADQALFHPLAYLSGLARAVNGDGCVVRDLAELGEVIQDPLAVIVNGKTIACDDVIIATHVPIMGAAGLVDATLFQTKLYPYSPYVVGGPAGADAPSPGLYWDTSDPYDFLRIHERNGDPYAIFGGKDHKTGQETDTEARFASLEQAFREILPSARAERRWSGQVIETSDGLPFIGQTADHQFVGTGYAGNGLTFGTLAGMMLRDAVMGAGNPWRELFDPHRKASSLNALTTLVTENIDYPLYFIADRLRRDSASGVENVRRGDGKVLVLDGKRVACHRTAGGEVIKVSAVCTHMGCLVRWNESQATWDCPCHGSRFTPEGLVIGGPAEAPLERIDD